MRPYVLADRVRLRNRGDVEAFLDGEMERAWTVDNLNGSFRDSVRQLGVVATEPEAVLLLRELRALRGKDERPSMPEGPTRWVQDAWMPPSTPEETALLCLAHHLPSLSTGLSVIAPDLYDSMIKDGRAEGLRSDADAFTRGLSLADDQRRKRELFGTGNLPRNGKELHYWAEGRGITSKKALGEALGVPLSDPALRGWAGSNADSCLQKEILSALIGFDERTAQND